MAETIMLYNGLHWQDSKYLLTTRQELHMRLELICSYDGIFTYYKKDDSLE